ncbi:MAG TPA: DNA-binding transcriptional regulator [Candidatus Limnocylindria bacterium]|nr:DNA-binding transcriptional regulator [Candidatus Limnocylindria bacterium]
MRKPPKVALLIETSNAYARGLMHGIVAYMREHRPWSIYLTEHSRGDLPPAWLGKWDGHGIIARVENDRIARALENLKIPLVDVSAARPLPTLPWVETNDVEIARLAAEHLLERGFKNFGYCGDERFNWSNWRRDAFIEAVRARGGECSVLSRSQSGQPDERGEIERVAKWLRRLPKPLGVMACYDLRGQQVLDACRIHGIQVPDDVAVIGVDNDELLCDLADPPLSSVIPNAHRAGYVAASLLDRMMAGQKVKAEAHLIDPLGVATRRSTDVLAMDDRNVAAAVRFIRDHACEGIRVRDVLKAVPQARRRLEAQFSKLVGRTPQAEITRVQLNRVKLLLAETDLPLDDIASRAGFVHAEYLSVVFKRNFGMPPSHYRTLNQQKRPPALRRN